MTRTGTIVTVAVVVHLALSIGHGLAHATIPVHVPSWQYAYAVVVILFVPLAGLGCIALNRTSVGLTVVLLAGIASLVFEGLFHFVIANPDHVATVAHRATEFTMTAALTTAGDVALVLVALWGLWHREASSRPRQPLTRTS